MSNAHQRFVDLMRQALNAYEEAHCGKTRKARRRGPLPLTAEERAKPIDPAIAAQVERRMVGNGWRNR
jgi:hypothetical protein